MAADRKYIEVVRLKKQGLTEKQIAVTLSITLQDVSQWLEKGSALIAEENKYAERYPPLKELQSCYDMIEIGKVREDFELNDEQLAGIVKIVKDDHLPVSLAASLVNLGEKKTEEVLALWRDKKPNVHTTTRIIENMLTEKAKALQDNDVKQRAIGKQIWKSQQTVSRMLNEKHLHLNMAEAVLVAIARGGEIDGEWIAPHALEALLQCGIFRVGAVQGSYIFTAKALEMVAKMGGREGSATWFSFINFLILDLAHFEKIDGDDKFREYIDYIIKARKRKRIDSLGEAEKID